VQQHIVFQYTTAAAHNRKVCRICDRCMAGCIGCWCDCDAPLNARRYSDLNSLAEILHIGDAVLLRGDWLMEYLKDQIHADASDWSYVNWFLLGGVRKTHAIRLPRREELPEEAIWENDELFERLPIDGSRRVKIVSISFPNSSTDDPNPSPEQLEKLIVAMQQWYDFYSVNFSWDLAVFCQRSSLFQPPWSEDEESSYRRAMNSLDLWFAHSWTDAWLIPEPKKNLRSGNKNGLSPMVTPLPSAAQSLEGTELDIAPGAAWQMLEYAVTRLMPSGFARSILDLELLDASFQDWESIDHRCHAKRLPVLLPEVFSQQLQNKALSSSADQKVVGEVYARAFRSLTSTVQVLYLQNIGWGDSHAYSLAMVMPSYRSLVTLHLADNRIGDRGIEKLVQTFSKCPMLSLLDLGSNDVGPEGARAIAGILPRCTQLVELNLHQNRIQKRGCAFLAASIGTCQMLEQIALGGNDIGDEGMTELAQSLPRCRALTLVGLNNNRISDKGIDALAKNLPKCRKLEAIRLNGNIIRCEGAAALADSIPRCTKIEKLHLARNQIGDQGAQAIAEQLVPRSQHLEVLHVQGNPPMSAWGKERIRQSWQETGKSSFGLQVRGAVAGPNRLKSSPPSDYRKINSSDEVVPDSLATIRARAASSRQRYRSPPRSSPASKKVSKVSRKVSIQLPGEPAMEIQVRTPGEDTPQMRTRDTRSSTPAPRRRKTPHPGLEEPSLADPPTDMIDVTHPEVSGRYL